MNRPPSYDNAYARAREGAPFSNSDEGYAWMSHWCDRCVHDAGARTGEGTGCPLVLVALLDRKPVEWADGNRDQLSTRYTCTCFHDEDKPLPEPPMEIPPEQDSLFDLEEA